MGILACTANDTLFIRLTDTPIPSLTPTPLAIKTKLKIGGKGVLVGVSDFAAIQMPSQPGPSAPGSGTATCFPSTRVEILDVSRALNNPADENIYYQVNCAGSIGWLAEYQLSAFGRGDTAVVKSSDGTGAPILSGADAARATTDVCADGSQVAVSGVSANQFNPTDQNVYVQITCGNLRGYVLDSFLAPES